ncbi:MAG: PGRS repeat-containing protein, partial [Mycobacterium sp.]
MNRRHTSSQRGAQPGNGLRHRNRVAGAGSAVAAFLAFGMAPLASAPSAQADVEDLFNFDWLSDMFQSDAQPADFSFNFEPGPAADFGTDLLTNLIYNPIHMVMEFWINNPLGEFVNGAINDMSGLYLIGDGADGTALNPDGGDGGLWFGDGGAGWTSDAAGVAGGNGGSALGWIGNGGDGGAGGAG